MRRLAIEEIPWIAEGATVLGAGGGGSAYQGGLMLRRHMRMGAEVTILDTTEVPDDARGPVLLGMGAPTVGIERVQPTGRWGSLVEGVRAAVGPIDFLAIGEIGGGNGLAPLVGAAEAALPVIDADPMGRAFPELQMHTYSIGGMVPQPLLLCDGKGVLASLAGVPDTTTGERYARALTWAMGGGASVAMGVVTGADVRRLGIPGTLTLAERIGRAMAAARQAKRPALEAILEVVPAGRHLFEGKIVDVERRTAAGFARGTVTVDGLDADRGARLRIEFQNEYLVARCDGKALLTVPDLIVLVDRESGKALGSETVRYGLRVSVLGLPAPLELKTPAALSVVGPQAFGYDDPLQPLAGDLLTRTPPASANAAAGAAL